MTTKKIIKLRVTEETNPALLYLLGLTTAASRRAQRSALVKFVNWAAQGVGLRDFPWSDIRHTHVLAFRDVLLEELKPKTLNRYITALRGVVRQAWISGLVDADTWARVREIPSVKSKSLPAGRELQNDDLRAMLRAAGAQPRRWLRKRDVAILSLLYCSGMRRAEIAALQLSDVVRDGEFCTFRVNGKGRRERLVPVPIHFIEPLEGWLMERGFADGPLFLVHRDLKQELKPDTVTTLVRGHARRAKIANVSPHDYRRTFGTRLLDNGADLVAVRDLLGHSHTQTTAGYDRRGERAKVAAVSKLPPGG